MMRTLTKKQSTHSQVKRCAAFLLVSFSHFLIFSAGAQTFTQSIQKETAGKGTVTINQSESIDKLVNSEMLGPAPTAAKPAAGSPATAAATKPGTTKPGTPSSNAQAKASQEQGEAEKATVDTSKKVMRNSYKINGYRVQAFAGGNSRVDRQKAERVGNNIKANYANVPVYVHFYSPRWICRVGNYRTYEEAHQMLVSLRNLGYTQSSIVKDKISVQY